jgi:hypothetical protein
VVGTRKKFSKHQTARAGDRRDGGAARKPAGAGGNPSYAGYEYQIGVTAWVGLELIVAKELTDALMIEPRSHEDVEAELEIDPEEASVEIKADARRFTYVLQAKSRSTEPWSARAIARVLNGNDKGAGGAGPAPRARPLTMLADDPNKHYLFVTNEALEGSLRPYQSSDLLDWPEATTLPPYARGGFDAVAQAAIAPRIGLCAAVTVEVLDARIRKLLTLHGHVPLANQDACVRDLRDEVRRRMLGYAGGCWTGSDLLLILARHGGSVLPTRVMDHYVRPQSYDAIHRSLDQRHAVVIAGPSGTGKTLTAYILEQELRRSSTPFAVVGEERGPGYVRAQLTRQEPLLFHLRDPWGGNRLAPGADRWSDELPKLLQHASANRKFLITSRSDVLLSAGHALARDLETYTVRIEIEDYGDQRLSEIYEHMCHDLQGPALDAARRHCARALAALRRPYEVDRFLVALTRDDPARPCRIEDIIAESQVDAISRVIAGQVAAWGDDGVVCAAIIWALLSARGAIAADLLPKVRRRLREFDPALRPEVDSFVDFLVAGRNLRQDGVALAFYHPRVEDGLRMALLERRGEAEHTLTRLADTLAAWDAHGPDWGIETVLGILRAVSKINVLELSLASQTQARLDAYLVSATAETDRRHGFESALEDLACYGSRNHVPSRLARVLVDGGPKNDEILMGETWEPPPLSDDEVSELREDPLTPDLVKRFVRDVLPFSRTWHRTSIVTLLNRLAPDLEPRFWVQSIRWRHWSTP